MLWTMLHPRATRDTLGFIPDFLNPADPRPAREQFNENYAHGGGWRPRPAGAFTVIGDGDAIQYPGDPPFPAAAMTMLRDEKIIVYAMSYVAIFQPDGTVEIARMD